jgi:acetyl esterase/lipase
MIAAAALALALGLSPAAAGAGGVRVVRDLDYLPSAEHAGGKDRLDVYAPAGARGAPVLVVFHGGGLREGDKAESAFVGERLAARGLVTVVPNYRLSPAVSHPEHVRDAAAAVAWVKRNIARHGGDPERVFVAGHSAGAYLAALLALDPRFLDEQGLDPTDVRGFAPVSGFYYVERIASDRPRGTWGDHVQDWIDASPVHQAGFGEVPPLLLLWADGDRLWRRNQHVEAARELREAGASDLEAVVVPGRDHATIWTRLGEDEGEPVARAILRFVERLSKDARAPEPPVKGPPKAR